jgi:hypothetical protein
VKSNQDLEYKGGFLPDFFYNSDITTVVTAHNLNYKYHHYKYYDVQTNNNNQMTVIALAAWSSGIVSPCHPGD